MSLLPTMPAVRPLPTGHHSPNTAIMYISAGTLTVVGGAASLIAWGGQAPTIAATLAVATLGIGVAGVVAVAMGRRTPSTKLVPDANTPKELVEPAAALIGALCGTAAFAACDLFMEGVADDISGFLSVVAGYSNGTRTIGGGQTVHELKNLILKATGPVFLVLPPSVALAFDSDLGPWLRSEKSQGRLQPVNKVILLDNDEPPQPALIAMAEADLQAAIDVSVVSRREAAGFAFPPELGRSWMLVDANQSRLRVLIRDDGCGLLGAEIHYNPQHAQWRQIDRCRKLLQLNCKPWNGARAPLSTTSAGTVVAVGTK